VSACVRKGVFCNASREVTGSENPYGQLTHRRWKHCKGTEHVSKASSLENQTDRRRCKTKAVTRSRLNWLKPSFLALTRRDARKLVGYVHRGRLRRFLPTTFVLTNHPAAHRRGVKETNRNLNRCACTENKLNGDDLTRNAGEGYGEQSPENPTGSRSFQSSPR
jgi:hypothetical protein